MLRTEWHHNDRQIINKNKQNTEQWTRPKNKTEKGKTMKWGIYVYSVFKAAGDVKIRALEF